MPDLDISQKTTVQTDSTMVGTDRSTSPPRAAALIIEFAADLDLNTIAGFRHTYRSTLEEFAAGRSSPGDSIILDLSRIDFVSVEAVFALTEAKDLATRSGLDFRLVTSTRGAEHALAATGKRQLFAYYESVEAALDAARVTAAGDIPAEPWSRRTDNPRWR